MNYKKAIYEANKAQDAALAASKSVHDAMGAAIATFLRLWEPQGVSPKAAAQLTANDLDHKP